MVGGASGPSNSGTLSVSSDPDSALDAALKEFTVAALLKGCRSFRPSSPCLFLQLSSGEGVLPLLLLEKWPKVTLASLSL